MKFPVLRVARPSNNLTALLPFYRDGLGFQLIGQFENHAGFDGLVLGHPQAPYHLEFTHEPGKPAGGAPSPEHLLVFYLPAEAAWQATVQRLRAAGFAPTAAHNPYWDQQGLTFQDPDGYGIVLQRAAWER
ncbi:VOC family protein [Hymenobacter sp. B81]|uniref:VOC family protein n=1 Tax=Hymenobacter sp. B81 TaxID=3344878 RepID=UPI0037DC906D